MSEPTMTEADLAAIVDQVNEQHQRIKPGEGLPIVPHLASQFYLWLWWRSEYDDPRIELGVPEGSEGSAGVHCPFAVDVWVDDRIVLRAQDGGDLVVSVRGSDPSKMRSARMAFLETGAIRQIRIGIRSDSDVEYGVTLEGPAMVLKAFSKPSYGAEEDDAARWTSLSVLEEFEKILGRMFAVFAAERIDRERWEVTATRIAEWLVSP